MTTFHVERVSDVLSEIKPLLEQHWKEIAHYDDPLDPDYAAYLALDGAGRIRVFTARDDSKLVGYAVFFIGNLHYKTTKIATEDLIFLLPEYRGTGVGYRLVRFCDQQLKAEGIQVCYHHVKLKHQELAQLITTMGYEPIDIIYGKRL